MNYVLYFCDSETSGLDSHLNDVIDVSFHRSSDGSEKTWSMKPINQNHIDAGALRVNGHKLEDLRHETKFGRDTYKDPNKIIIEIENWVAEDNVPAENRILCGHNIHYDKSMLEQLWIKCNSADSYPFSKRRTMDTMHLEFFLDWCNSNMAEGYSLSNLVKKYGVKNEKAHSALADMRATKEVFEKQVSNFRKILGIK